MLIKTTLIATTPLTVSKEGKTVGEFINDSIVQSMNDNELVTNISVEITQEDWIALRLLKAPAGQDDTGHYRPPFKSKLRPSSGSQEA